MDADKYTSNEDLLEAVVAEANENVEPKTDEGTPDANNVETNNELQDASVVDPPREEAEESGASGQDNNEEPEGDSLKPEEEAPADDSLIGGKFKSMEELLKAYEEAENRITEIGQERSKKENEYRQAIEEVLQWKHEQEELMASEAEAPPAGSPTSIEELDELAYNDPVSAAAFAADYAPEYMPRVLTAISQYDPQTAQEIQALYSEWQMDQKLAPIYERELSIAEDEAKKVAARQFANDFKDYKEYAEDIKNNINEIREGNDLDISDPNILYRVMENAYYKAKATSNKVEYTSDIKKSGGSLESGNPGYTPDVPEPDEAAQIAAETLQYANKNADAMRKFLGEA